jgi:hypothetical protein
MLGYKPTRRGVRGGERVFEETILKPVQALSCLIRGGKVKQEEVKQHTAVSRNLNQVLVG